MRIAQLPKSLILGAGSAALLVLSYPQAGIANSKCVEGLWPSAKSAGVTRATFDRAFQGFAPDPEVIEAANYQPEYVKPVGEYIDRAVSEKRIQIGKQKLVEYQSLLGALENRYGVDRTIIVAIWGVESDFGASLGTFPVLDAWATLACHKPSELRVSNFYGSMRLLASGRVAADRFTGSWSGAFGLTQFIPTSYESYAADGDDDGKVNLFDSVPDAMASTARHLTERTRWIRGLPAAIEVAMPAPLLEELSRGSDDERWVKTARPLSVWAGQQVTRSDGADLLSIGVAATTPLQALLTEGAKGRVFLISSNFEALMSYNKSTKYAIAVAVLAKRLQESAQTVGAAASSDQDKPPAPAPAASAASSN